ncbi:MAG: putative ABC transporter permease [Mediterraneibacter gnavus]
MRHHRLVHGNTVYRTSLPFDPKIIHLQEKHPSGCFRSTGWRASFSPLSQKLKDKKAPFCGGSIYTAFIFAGEFLSGLFLKKHRICPWDYSRAKFNIKGVIRLDYAPLWFTAGLFFEKFLKKF